MKPIFFNIFIFIFIIHSAVGQSDSLISGEYTFIEQKGVQGKPGTSIGDLNVTSYIVHVDTRITSKLLLDTNHNVIFQIDSVFSSRKLEPGRKWCGHWKVENDTLKIQLTELSTLWPFSIDGKEPTPIIEKLTIPITKEYVFEKYEHHINGLILVGEDRRRIVYKKK